MCVCMFAGFVMIWVFGLVGEFGGVWFVVLVCCLLANSGGSIFSVLSPVGSGTTHKILTYARVYRAKIISFCSL